MDYGYVMTTPVAADSGRRKMKKNIERNDRQHNKTI